jgi:hypothetical protein
LHELGYLNPTEKQVSRLSNVLDSPVLGLDGTLFDLKYSNSEYIKKLAAICGFSPQIVEDVIDEITDKLQTQKNAFKPYLFVNTGFKRTTQPIFALAACEHFRYLTLPKDLIDKSALEQLAIVHEKIDKHLHETGGFIGIWGNVISYLYVYNRGAALEISPTGKILGTHNNFEPDSHARIEHKGKELKFG